MTNHDQDFSPPETPIMSDWRTQQLADFQPYTDRSARALGECLILLALFGPLIIVALLWGAAGVGYYLLGACLLIMLGLVGTLGGAE